MTLGEAHHVSTAGGPAAWSSSGPGGSRIDNQAGKGVPDPRVWLKSAASESQEFQHRTPCGVCLWRDGVPFLSKYSNKNVKISTSRAQESTGVWPVMVYKQVWPSMAFPFS